MLLLLLLLLVVLVLLGVAERLASQQQRRVAPRRPRRNAVDAADGVRCAAAAAAAAGTAASVRNRGQRTKKGKRAKEKRERSLVKINKKKQKEEREREIVFQSTAVVILATSSALISTDGIINRPSHCSVRRKAADHGNASAVCLSAESIGGADASAIDERLDRRSGWPSLGIRWATSERWPTWRRRWA